MRQPTEVILDDGYQLCAICGQVMVNGEPALVVAEVYCHLGCTHSNRELKQGKRIFPPAWKRAFRAEDALDQPDEDKRAYPFGVINLAGHNFVLSVLWSELMESAETLPVDGVGAQCRENQTIETADDEGNAVERVAPTGQRWNGQVLVGAKQTQDGLAEYCDSPRVPRWLAERVEREILQEERANLYVTWERPILQANEQENAGRPLLTQWDDARTSIGLDVEAGRVTDSLPTESEDYDDSGESDAR